MAKYKTIATTTWYTTAGQVGGRLNSGYVFESVTTQAKKDVVCRNETGTNKWIPAVNCTEVTASPPPVDPPTEPPAETFPTYIPIGGLWYVRFQTDPNDMSTLTDQFVFKRIS